MLNNDQRDEALSRSPSDTRLTPERIKAKIAGEKYWMQGEEDKSDTTTICVLTLENGFTVVGKSACVDPANFNRELGQKIAYDDAFRQIWALEGYLLREQAHQGDTSAKAAA